MQGAIAARVASTTSAGPCGRFPGGYVASLNLDVSTSVYVLTIEVPGYLEPGEYPAPPARVSLHPAHSLQPILYIGVRGSVNVAADERTGRVNEVMTSDSGSVTVSGPWAC
jgi:hypothetical protein